MHVTSELNPIIKLGQGLEASVLAKVSFQHVRVSKIGGHDKPRNFISIQ